MDNKKKWGGRRHGAGIKPGTKKKNCKNWQKIGLTLSTEMIEYLNTEKSNGQNKSTIVDLALRYFRKNKGDKA